MKSKTLLAKLLTRLKSHVAFRTYILNRRPHFVVLRSDYLSKLGLTKAQIKTVHTAAKGKAARNKGRLKGYKGWDEKEEILLLTGGNNYNRSRDITKLINSFVGNGSLDTGHLFTANVTEGVRFAKNKTGVDAKTTEEVNKVYNKALGNYRRRVTIAMKKAGLDITSTWATSYTKNRIKGVYTVFVTPQSVDLNQNVIKAFELAFKKEIVENIPKIQSSPSLEDRVNDILKNSFTGKKSKSGKRTVVNKARIKSKGKVSNSVLPPLRDVKGRFTSTLSLKNLINKGLADAIEGNMGKSNDAPIKLRYQTGRFADSAKVTNIIQTREDALQVYYTFMGARNSNKPYGLFIPGNSSRASAVRNPKTIISKSIRELAFEIIGAKFKLRNILV